MTPNRSRCMLAANRNFVRNYPNATKRVLRAVLKAADLCATDPNRIACQPVHGGFTDRYDYALQILNEAPYQWRDFDPEDSLRFYALEPPQPAPNVHRVVPALVFGA